ISTAQPPFSSLSSFASNSFHHVRHLPSFSNLFNIPFISSPPTPLHTPFHPPVTIPPAIRFIRSLNMPFPYFHISSSVGERICNLRRTGGRACDGNETFWVLGLFTTGESGGCVEGKKRNRCGFR